ncbi:two-component regulator propeller domain-containing protein [Gracilimonas sp.]|uniref:ligand-binding sensor domain-containing protein n=1 Tax=Gracilimonas sp. TaxID=1974203 RepID=UPI002870C26C|nr:two-component regulator propeller domain-containing protein [Gracilimonas sp.]
MIRWLFIWIIGGLIPLLFIQFAFSQEIGEENYVVTHFGMEDGLPQSTVNDILQSQDGYIWIATNGGLVRFDGLNFTTFNRSNSPNMHYDRIIKIYEDRKGVLWVTTENGLLRLKDGVFKAYIFNEGSIRESPREMKEDENDVLWATIFGKVYRYSGEDFIEVPVSADPKLTQQAKEEAGGVWLVNDENLYKTIGDSVVVVKNFKNYVGSSLLNSTEFPEGSGTLFIGTMSDGIIKYENEEITFFNGSNGLPSDNFIDFKKDKKGNLYAQVFGALSIWNGTNFERFQPFEDSGDIRFQQILEDNEGNYWIGTAADGLFKLNKSIITMIDEEDGLQNEKMLALMQLKDGSALFSTNCGGIYHWKDGQLSIPKDDFIAENGCFWSMYEDSQGRFWFGARGVYVTESLDEPGTFLGVEEGFSSAEIFAITEDSKGNMWIATSDFLVIYNEGIIRRFTTEDGLYYNDARILFEDEDGTMWAGTGQGLNKIKDDTVYKVDLLVSEDDSPIIQQPYVRAIHKDDEGVMWVGTYGHGIFRLKDGNIDNVTTAQGLFDNIVSHIIEDENGYFWMGSNRGISRVSKSDLDAVIAGKIEVAGILLWNR